MEKWVSKWLEMHSQRQILMRGGSIPSLILFPHRCLRRRFKPLAFSASPPPPGNQPLWVKHFLYIYFVAFNIWQCVMFDSNFNLHLQLQYSKGNKKDITMTYTISRRGSVLRLADSNLSM